MNRSTPDIVCDAGPLIHLDELGCLSLLNDFNDIMIPEQVWREVSRIRPLTLNDPQTYLRSVPVEISSENPLKTLFRALSLGNGEQAALSLMKKHPESIFLTDDAAARLAAVSLGCRVHGTIGVLIRSIRRRQRKKEEVLSILENLPSRSTLFIKPSLLQEIIDNVEKQAPE